MLPPAPDLLQRDRPVRRGDDSILLKPLCHLGFQLGCLLHDAAQVLGLFVLPLDLEFSELLPELQDGQLGACEGGLVLGTGDCAFLHQKGIPLQASLLVPHVLLQDRLLGEKVVIVFPVLADLLLHQPFLVAGLVYL